MAGWFNWQIKWDIRPGRVIEWLAEVRAAQIERQVRRVAERNAKQIEAWMKSNAPWTDRTGQARATLRSEVLEVTGRGALILLRYGVEYGVYLETVSGGSFAIIGPALDRWAPVIWRDLQIELAGGTLGE